jgi:hypothetical protein
MTTSNTHYNPIFRATRAAFAELTTAEALRWYGTQAKATAARASAIATGIHTISHLSIAVLTRLLQRKPALAAVERVEIAGAVDEAISSTEVTALAKATAPEQAKAPAAWPTRAVNSGVVHERVQAIAPAEVSSETDALEQETVPPVWAATEVNEDMTAFVDDDGLEASLALAMATEDDPLPGIQIPFNDELECGPLFLSEEEDTSFFSPEEDGDTDKLISEDTDPDSFSPPSNLSAMIQAYLRENSSPAESVGEDAIAHPSSTSDSVVGASAFAWEEHQAASESAAEAEAGK